MSSRQQAGQSAAKPKSARQTVIRVKQPAKVWSPKPARKLTKAYESKLHGLVRDYASSDVMRHISIVRQGIPARSVSVIAGGLGLSKKELATGLDMSVATLDRKVRKRVVLSTPESERVAGLMQLVGIVERWAEELGDGAPENFVPTTWLGRWLKTANPALGGAQPLQLMDTAEGRTLVTQVLESLETGAYW